MIRIGPAGWDYQDWQGVVYPPAVRGTDRLTFLTQFFATIEINVTFYRPITATLARRWVEAVEGRPDFRFTAKLFRGFTHERTADSLAGGGGGKVGAGGAAGGRAVGGAPGPVSLFLSQYRGKSSLSAHRAGAFRGLSPGHRGAAPLLAAAGGAAVSGGPQPGFLQHRPAADLVLPGRNGLGERPLGLSQAARPQPAELVCQDG